MLTNPLAAGKKDTQLGRLIKEHVVFPQMPKQGKGIRLLRRCPRQMCGSDLSRHRDTVVQGLSPTGVDQVNAGGKLDTKLLKLLDLQRRGTSSLFLCAETVIVRWRVSKADVGPL